MPPPNFFYTLLMRRSEREQGHLEAQLTEFKKELKNQTADKWRETISQNLSTGSTQTFYLLVSNSASVALKSICHYTHNSDKAVDIGLVYPKVKILSSFTLHDFVSSCEKQNKLFKKVMPYGAVLLY